MLRLVADAHGAPVTVEVHGEGPPVVLVTAAVTRAWAEPLALALRRDHAVVTFDYEPYEGWDGRPDARTSVAMASDVLAVMDAIGLARAHVVGISRGAVTGYALATRHPDRVLSLALLVPVAPFTHHLQVETPTPAIEDDEDLVEAAGRVLFSDAFREDHPEQVRAIALDPGGSVVRVDRAQEQPLPTDEVPDQPTLIVTAADDHVVPSSNADALEQAIPQARRVELPGGHGAMVEAPRAWADALRRFVAEVNAAG